MTVALVGAGPGDPGLITVAGMDACSKMRPCLVSSGPATTVAFGIHGEMSTAGTRTPNRSNAKGWPMPVSAADATNPSGLQAGGGT